jgi:hypothetical protein
VKLRSEILSPDLMCLLVPLVEYDGELDEIKSTIKRARRPYRFWLTLFVAILVVSVGLMYIGFIALFAKPAPNFAAPALVSGLVIYVVIISLGFMTRPRFAQYNSFRAICNTVPKVNPALGSALASDKRKALAAGLIHCSDCIRALGPPAPLGLPGKIMRQQAIQASQVLRHLVYPAMLGSDEDLEAIRSVLGPAALKIGTSNWVRIGELTVETGQYRAVKPGLRVRPSSELALLFFTALAAIPAIPVLVSILR